MQIKSHMVAKYLVTFINDFSRYTVANLIASKSEAFEKFVEYKALMENQTKKKNQVYSNRQRGGEYINKKFTYLCRNAGIIHTGVSTAPYSPQQNGLTERMNRTLMERARSMIARNNVDKQWWAEEVNTAASITNRITCSVWKSKTPIEVCFETRSNLSNFCVFGSKGLAHIDKTKRQKLDDKGLSSDRFQNKQISGSANSRIRRIEQI